MNAFGTAARHTIASAMPDQTNARDAIAPGVQYEIAQDPPPLTGGLSVARYEAIARYIARFDLVLTYNWGAIDGVMAKRAFPKTMVPIVHHEDGFNADEADGLKIQRNLYRRMALAAASALAVPSETLEKIALTIWKQPADKVRRIVNGIPVDRYAKPPQTDAIPGFRRGDKDVVVGTLAGLREVKDLPMLVRAVGGLPERVKLVIVGEGPERAKIEAAGRAMGMGDRLILPGFLPEPHRYVGLFDIMALSSKSEQFPISVVEGMAAGLPIVAPAVGDILTMLSPNNGAYIARDRDEVWLRNSLESLVLSPERRKTIGGENRARAMAEYGEDRMIARYRALYETALGRPNALAA